MRLPDDGIDRLARRAARRLTFQRALGPGIVAANAVALGLAASVLATLAVPLTPVAPLVAVAAAGAAFGLVIAGVALLRRTDALAAARVVDARAGLLDRLSTALEVRPRAARSLLGARLLADAAAHAASVNLRAALPWRMPRSWPVLPLVVLFLFIWSSFFRGIVLPGTPAQRTREAIRQEGSRIERFAQSLQSRTRTERAPQSRRLAPQLRQLGQGLQRDRLDRTEALARIAELGRQVDQARREVDSRLRAESRPRTEDGSLPSELFRRQALQQQIRQLRELATRLQQQPESASPDVLQRLGDVGRDGDGNQPARAREQLQRAREQLERGNSAAAGEALNDALRELEGLDRLLADAEGLRNAQQQLERSQRAIGDGGSRLGGEVADEQAPPRGTPGDAPGENRPSQQAGADERRAPEGPFEGTTPGQGRGGDKLGPPTQRLEAQRTPERLRGAQGEGPAGVADVLGAGRPGSAQAPVAGVSPSIVAQADRAMEKARTPAKYRGLVRRYFERLAKLR
jgi:hypothetical protein